MNFDDYQRKYAYRLLSHLAETPGDFHDHLQLCIPPFNGIFMTRPQG